MPPAPKRPATGDSQEKTRSRPTNHSRADRVSRDETAMTPAIWSAVAASLSALAAWFSFLLNRRNAVDSTRPDLVLEGWGLEVTETPGQHPKGTLHIDATKNLGRGPARHVWIEVINPEKQGVICRTRYNKPTSLHPSESKQIACSTEFEWKDGKCITIEEKNSICYFYVLELVLHYWDTRNYKHELTYLLRLTHCTGPYSLKGFFGDEVLAEGVGLTDRRLKVRRSWGTKGSLKSVKDERRIFRKPGIFALFAADIQAKDAHEKANQRLLEAERAYRDAFARMEESTSRTPSRSCIGRGRRPRTPRSRMRMGGPRGDDDRRTRRRRRCSPSAARPRPTSRRR